MNDRIVKNMDVYVSGIYSVLTGLCCDAEDEDLELCEARLDGRGLPELKAKDAALRKMNSAIQDLFYAVGKLQELQKEAASNDD